MTMHLKIYSVKARAVRGFVEESVLAFCVLFCYRKR
jgi:hypothetical protein